MIRLNLLDEVVMNSNSLIFFFQEQQINYQILHAQLDLRN